MNVANLLHWALLFLAVALLAALLGFTGLAGAAAGGARILFWVAVIAAIVAFIVNTLRSS